MSRYQEYLIFDYVIPLTAAMSVSVPAPLVVPTNFFGNLRGLCLEVINLDPTNSVTVQLVPIPDGVSPDPAKQVSFTVGPKQSGSTELNPYVLRQMFEVTANTQAPGYPTVMVQIQLLAYLRQT